MRTHIIKNGIIINTIVATIEEAAQAFSDCEIAQNDEFSIGDLYDNGVFTKAPIVVPEPLPIQVPQTITKLQAMKQMKSIGKWEAFKAVLASDDDINDEWVLSDNINRSYSLVLSVAQLFEFTDEDMDTFFIEASKL